MYYTIKNKEKAQNLSIPKVLQRDDDDPITTRIKLDVSSFIDDFRDRLKKEDLIILLSFDSYVSKEHEKEVNRTPEGEINTKTLRKSYRTPRIGQA
jgi:hypothetical protein